ncbi:MAG: thiamine diphosphokinase [Oscillospiraceae bacterium]|nr:thiamine diphosphokinase [Oscillospiraceae bacterium]
MGKEIKDCILVSGAPDDDYEFLKAKIDKNKFIIAADSGYKKLLKIGIMPDLIMGDFDSSECPNENICEIIKLPAEKDYTDTFYCVREAIKRGCKNLDIYCAIGDRFDHTYSNVLCLDYCKKNNVFCRIINKKNRLSLICEERSFKKEYDSFSLFAYLENCYGVRISGAYYTAGFFNKDALDIGVGDQFAQSNFVSSDLCTVSLRKGTLLLVESND